MEKSDSIQATGVPPHVEILKSIKLFEEKTRKSYESLQEIVSQVKVDVVKEITEMLEDRAIGAGVVTFEGLSKKLEGVLKRIGVHDLIAKSKADSSATSNRKESQAPVFNFTQQKFSLPKCEVSKAWVMWWKGQPDANIPPWRRLKPSDMPSKNQKKRLSELKFLMRAIEKEAKNLGLLDDEPSLENLERIFDHASICIPISSTTKTGKKRKRKGQLLWSTAAKYLRTSKE